MHQLRVASPTHSGGEGPQEQGPLSRAPETHPHYPQSPLSERVELYPCLLPWSITLGYPHLQLVAVLQ